MKWRETTIETSDGQQKAIAPEVISASRSTDIPAYYSKWFMHRLRQGYVKWLNPFNQRPQYVSFSNAKVIVFWSKNPRPLMKHLQELEDRRLSYYFQFTLNDYEAEKLEPGVPALPDRIQTFKDLSKQIGKERVIWRFDPLILANGMTVEALLNKIKQVGDQIAPYTEKLVFSFADIGTYRKVINNLNRVGITYSDFTQETMLTASESIGEMCKKWGIAASTCAESLCLTQFGIEPNKCIDDQLILRIAKDRVDLKRLYGIDLSTQADLFAPTLKSKQCIKDPGQREECGCVFSKDIGQYNTCPHLCVYCYANTSESIVNRNVTACSQAGETILETSSDRMPL
ncbi:MAG: DUF1848 domain-containing protein [Verrucomicrobiota bacterium]|nr:DUF1848 domain-containing protein [Verrucomicrobiota bacterium]